MRLHCPQLAVRIVAHLELRQKRMAMAGEHHVLIAIEPYPHRSTGVMRCECCERCGRSGLRFLPAETTAHARHLHHNFIRGQV